MREDKSFFMAFPAPEAFFINNSVKFWSSLYILFSRYVLGEEQKVIFFLYSSQSPSLFTAHIAFSISKYRKGLEEEERN
jgi:hypothetical protein